MLWEKLTFLKGANKVFVLSVIRIVNRSWSFGVLKAKVNHGSFLLEICFCATCQGAALCLFGMRLGAYVLFTLFREERERERERAKRERGE